MRIAILSGILFLSGISALIFQTLWLRLSGLAFGNSVWSAALVLSSFMAGLALGGAIAAFSQLRKLRPLHLYALLEFAVALFGCTIVFGLPLLGEWMRPVFQSLWTHHAILNGLRFGLSFLILLIPTTAMGLTLPVLLDDSALKRYAFGRAVGFLYGWNTLGAVAGSLLGEAHLIKTFGLWGTGVAAALVSCTAGVAALLVASVSANVVPGASSSQLVGAVKYRPPWRLLVVSMGTGGILLSLELVWFRFLRLYVASSSTAFAVMLAVVLAGIGTGGVAAGIMRRRFVQASPVIPLLSMAAAITALLSYIFFPVPAPQGIVAAVYIESWKEIALLALPLMFPVAFLSGILFPCIVSRVQANVERPLNSAGITTLFNTIGAAIGPLLTSFVLLPSIGFQWTLMVCAGGYALLAVLGSDWSIWSVKRPTGVAIFGLCLGLILIVTVFPYHRDDAHFASARRPYEADGSRLVKKIEGTSDTLQLLRRDLFGEPYYYRLLTNAFSMSATLPQSQRYMRLFAYLPLALRPQSEDALLICYGVGVTADALSRDPRLKRIDIVDISKEVFELADDYSGSNYSNPLRDSRTTKFIQDGRFFLQASPRQYDVITGEPPPLKIAGTVNLYTEEFFSLMRSRLKEGGIATFWLPIYQLKVDETKAILRAFHNAFPNASVWAGNDLEWIMMGINGPGQKPQADQVRWLWKDEATRSDLVRIGIEVPEQLAALYLMDGEEIDRIAQGIKPLTDFFPKRLSDTRPDIKTVHRFAWPYMEAASAARNFRSSPLIARVWPRTLTASVEPFFLVRATRFRSSLEGSNWLAELEFYLRNSQLRSPVLDVLNSDEFRVSLAERLVQASPQVPVEALPDLVAGALARRDITGAISLLERERDHGFKDHNEFFLLTYLYCLNGNVEKAEDLAATYAERIPKDWFVGWLWGTLQAEFGFRPPR